MRVATKPVAQMPAKGTKIWHRLHQMAEQLPRIGGSRIQLLLVIWIASEANRNVSSEDERASCNGWTRPIRLSRLRRILAGGNRDEISEPGLAKLIDDGAHASDENPDGRGIFEVRREKDGFCFRLSFDTWETASSYSPGIPRPPKKGPSVAEEADPETDETATTSSTIVGVGKPFVLQAKAKAQPVSLPSSVAKVHVENRTEHSLAFDMSIGTTGLRVQVTAPDPAPVVPIPRKADPNCSLGTNAAHKGVTSSSGRFVQAGAFTAEVNRIAIDRTGRKLQASQLDQIAKAIPAEDREAFVGYLPKNLDGLKQPGYAVMLAKEFAPMAAQARRALAEDTARAHARQAALSPPMPIAEQIKGIEETIAGKRRYLQSKSRTLDRATLQELQDDLRGWESNLAELRGVEA